MPHIQVLETHVADLIAAGEVVERPASVVKELMENAIDAGAATLTVEIQRGGMTYIRITDDGCGIDPDDMETAFLRHATSKIRTQYDLEAIGTLGFRGEALAAIGAVSRVEVLTRTAEHDFGCSLTVEGGVVTSRGEAGCPKGTTMVVRDLFYNTPARLKYMKRDASEGAAVFAVVQREALAHPEVAVKFIREGKQDLITPGDGTLKSAVYAVLGRDLALGFTAVNGSGEDGISVEGFASLPACCRGARNYQYFFVNGRFIKSRTMVAALEEAYRNQHMVGKFPGCVLHVRVRLNGVDVNVHPAKTEVKFVSEKRVFNAVYHCVKGTLEGTQEHVKAVIPTEKPQEHDTVTPNQTAFRAMTAQEYRQAPAASPRPSHYPIDVEGPAGGLPFHDFARPRFEEKGPTPTAQPMPQGRVEPTPAVEEYAPAVEAVPARQETVMGRAQAPIETSVPDPEPIPWTVRGELFHTYVLVEQGETTFIIDKHAAHERINFDKLKAEGYTPMQQQLLVPVAFTPSPEEGAALLQNLDILAQFGFECEDFGGGAVLVRQSPDYVPAGEIEATLLELAGPLSGESRVDAGSARDALMATMACKAAIKGGQKNGPQELHRVAEAVMSGAVKYCPHGRPVAIELTRKQLEKLFRRI